MPILRRYLLITPFSVLECRILLHNPSDRTWLLTPGSGRLENLFDTIRPILPRKLAETRTQKKVKVTYDVVKGEGFEVSVSMTKTGVVHGVLVKDRVIVMGGVGSKGKVREERGKQEEVVVRVESDEENEGEVQLGDVPEVREGEGVEERPLFKPIAMELSDDDEEDEDEDELQPRRAGSDDEEYRPDVPHPFRSPKRKGRRPAEPIEIDTDSEDDDEGRQTLGGEDEEEEKKKDFRMRYNGYETYSWVLNLHVTRDGAEGEAVVGGVARAGEKRKGKQPVERVESGVPGEGEGGEGKIVSTSRYLMDEWIQMSQAVRNHGDDL